jgi:hypothetical protein
MGAQDVTSLLLALKYAMEFFESSGTKPRLHNNKTFVTNGASPAWQAAGMTDVLSSKAS